MREIDNLALDAFPENVPVRQRAPSFSMRLAKACAGGMISDLTGIQCLTNLTSLVLLANIYRFEYGISEISALVSNLGVDVSDFIRK